MTFYFMVVVISFTFGDGNKMILRLEHSQHFETRALCDSHLPYGLAEVQAMVNAADYPIPEAKFGVFSPECAVEEKDA